MIINNHDLNKNQIHLWIANLDLTPAEIQEYSKTLSADEQTRAQRFRFEIHRARFIAARGILRGLLGGYLGVEASKIQFEYSNQGKPKIASVEGSNLEFNLSHSQDLAIYGFTLNRLIGVDVEYLRDFKEMEGIAKRFFSSKEYEVIQSLPHSQQQEAFFRGWTAKEAYLKATGEGIAGGLNVIEIDLNPKHPLRLVNINNWCLYEVVPAPNYLGAIAISSQEELELTTYTQ